MTRPLTIGVTGATGFIGRAYIEALAKNGYRVRAFGRRAGINLGAAITETLPENVEAMSGLDCLVHLAGEKRSKAADLRQANVEAPIALAELARDAGVSRFVFVSSIGVHGKASHALVSPDSPIAPANAYAHSKAVAEKGLRATLAGSATELVTLRPPMIYGHGGGGSFDALKKLIRLNWPLPFGRATARRSFCSLNNVVSALTFALDADISHPIILPADSESISLRSMVTIGRDALGTASPLVPVPISLMATGLGLLGKADLSDSLFSQLVIDQDHWSTCGWAPIEDGSQAMSEAFAASPS